MCIRDRTVTTPAPPLNFARPADCISLSAYCFRSASDASRGFYRVASRTGDWLAAGVRASRELPHPAGYTASMAATMTAMMGRMRLLFAPEPAIRAHRQPDLYIPPG